MKLRRYVFLLCLLPGLAAAAEVPRHDLPPVQVQAAVDTAKQDPLRYAAALATNLNTPDGAWDAPAAGIARWRLGIDSDSALSLALRLEDLRLPAGAELRWIGDDSGDVQGPFGADSSGTLWLPLVRGARATLEVRLPTSLKNQFGVRVAEAQHGFVGFGQASTAKGQFGDAEGACHIDVACAAANDWRPQVRSVVLLTINGRAQCTGTLVTNVRNDETPFILTANHCDFDGVSASSIRAYFNVNRGGCGSGTDGRVDQNIRASEVVALNATSDFALLRLLASENGRRVTDFNVFFAGWDVTGTAPGSGAAIHHPHGDDKKISQYTGATKQDNVLVGDFRVDAWEVFWNSGTTEQGSSGSALWNQNGRVIGVLSGGTAACSGRNPNNQPDYFGRLELAWTGTDKAIGSTLKAALDPDNTGTTSMAGLNRGTDPPPSTSNPPTGDSGGGGGGGGGGALPALLLSALAGLGLLRRARRLKR